MVAFPKMPQQQVDLDAVYYIINHFSEEISEDCCQIIAKLLKSLSLSMFHESKFVNEKAFASVNVLLNLLEYINPKNANTELERPLDNIMENLKCVFHCNNECCNLPESAVQVNILATVSSVLKCALLQNSSKSLMKLLEFYNYSLTSTGATIAKRECKSDCLIFKLKIINLIYRALANIAFESLVEFRSKIKLENELSECELLTDLVLHEDNAVAIHTLLHLIPAQINCFKSGRVVEVFWKRIPKSLTEKVSCSRELTVLCQIFDLCSDKSESQDKVDSLLSLIKDGDFWELIQFSLKARKPIERKQGLYLFKKSVNLLYSLNENFLYSINNNICYWQSCYKEELYETYMKIITILEFLEEQQIHIIKPIFTLVEAIVEKIFNYRKVDLSWVLLIYEKALLHESLQVVELGIQKFLCLPVEFFLYEYIARKSGQLLATCLNSTSVYLKVDILKTDELGNFLNKISKLDTNKIFFSTLIKELCSQIWDVEALFFTIRSLSKIEKCSIWGKEEISEMVALVMKDFKAHKIIRTGIQIEILNTSLRLANKKDGTLENIIFLISILFERNILKVGSQMWMDIVLWLKNSYSKEDAKIFLEKHIMEKSKIESKCMWLVLILYIYTYDLIFDVNDLEQSDESLDKNSFAFKYFEEVLLLYKNAHKRPYCDKLILDQNLLIICNIYKANLNGTMTAFIRPTLPFLKDVILYIQTRLSENSSLQDFTEWELYLNTFENILKTLTLFNFDTEFINYLHVEILKDLELFSQSDESTGMLWRFKFLNIILKMPTFKPKHSFLDSYLLKAVNESLKKDEDFRYKTRDLLTLWHRMNSEFLEQKWITLEYLINNKLVLRGRTEDNCWISDDDVVVLCLEALDLGGYGVLCPVMSILKNLLPAMESQEEIGKIIISVWKLIMERKKNEQFKTFVKHFLEMIFHKSFIERGESAREILMKHADLIFSNSSVAVVNIFMKHIQHMEITTESVALFCNIIKKGLIFGPIEKRNKTFLNGMCCAIDNYLKTYDFQEISEYNISSEIRARAVQKVLQFDRNSPVHQTLARQLIEAFFKVANELNNNRTRHFTNSHVHRVNLRIMQALLLLEPILNENEACAIKLSRWVSHRLVSENSQPSVRHMLEWLLIRIMVRHSEVFSRFSINNYICSEEKKQKGLCSFIIVSHHSLRLVQPDLMRARIFRDFYYILPYCFHPRSKLRLLAQSMIFRLCHFVNVRNLKEIPNCDILYDALNTNFNEEAMRKKRAFFGSSYKFYLDCFYPLENYSLESIYRDLPRLTDVASDEWILNDMFLHCGVDSKGVNAPLKDLGSPLSNVISNKWISESYESSTSAVLKSESVWYNYQKKNIPIRSLIPGWKENNSGRDTGNKGGLIVVASLIDRIPNLGGLARTCEVFGASEYIVKSLNYIKDKQFTSLSVTAEKWITVKEVKIQDLFTYVSKIKKSGYTIIGAEQTLNSQPLNSVKFPKKSLLLLGNEKEGIPPNLLPFLDVCVEVPQLGLIRSLNVHVTGALFIWEYAKQHYFT